MFSGEGKQGDLPRLFDGFGYNTLVFCARASLPARTNLAVFVDVFSEQVSFLVINREGLVSAELTKFGFGKEAALAASLRALV